MRRVPLLVAVPVMICELALAQPVAQPAPTTRVESAELPILRTDAQKIELLAEGLFGGLIEARHVPGAVFVVVKDEEILFARGYGYADVESKRPVDPERTLFRVASVSKLVTATAAMQLVEDGKIRLDADVNDYIDMFKLPDTYPQPITLHHLMTHTAGFDDRFKDTAGWPDAPEIPLGEFLARTMPARVMPPGEVINYSNMGWALTGHLVERIRGKSFSDYVRQKIFEPLGMGRSRFGVGNPPPADMATPYRSGGATGLEAVGFDRDHMGPAAELVTTGTDIARFMLAHLNKGIHEGRVILHPDTIALMQAQHFSNAPGLDGWAYGFWERRRNGWRAIGHDGSWRGFGSILMLVPEARMGFFISVNKDYDPILFRSFVQTVFDHLFPPREGALVEPVASAESPAVRAEALAGTYIPVRRVRSDFMKVGQLLSEVQVAAVDEKRLRVSAGERPREFIFSAGLWLEDHLGQRRLAVVDAEDGRVRRIAIEQSAFDRAAWFETRAFNTFLTAIVFVIAFSSFIAWGVWGPIRLRLGAAQSATPLALRLAIVASSLLTLVFLAVIGVTLATAYPMDIIAETPLGLRLAAWIPLLLIVQLAPFAYFIQRALRAEGFSKRQHLLALLPLLALLLTLWLAWFWNLHAFAV